MAEKLHGDLALSKVREICLSFPGANERESHGTPAFFCGRQFAMCWPDGHHDAGFAQLWLAAAPGVQQHCILDEPARYFRPPYVGPRGWVGVSLEGDPPWGAIEALCEDAFRAVAPARLVRLLDAGEEGPFSPLPHSAQ